MLSDYLLFQLHLTSNMFYTFKGKELRVQLSATDPENRTIRYSFVQNETFGASLKNSGFFTFSHFYKDHCV